MGFLQYIQADLKNYPPFLINGDNFTCKLREIYLSYSEAFNTLIVGLLFLNYIFFCGELSGTNFTFRVFNTVISGMITFDIIVKIALISPLYFNKYYYGSLFIVFDFLSGPTCLIYNMVDFREHLIYADIFILFRVFCMQKIRLLIMDIIYILWVSRYINLALFLTFYVYSYISYRMFQDISPTYFRNVFVSMLSMFQVLTLDSWNNQVNQSVATYYGQVWGFYFVFFIFFMFFYFINLLLGAFVSYYSNPDLRVNFEYSYDHDSILNKDLKSENESTVLVKDALNILGLQNEEQNKIYEWGLKDHQGIVLLFAFIQIISEIIITIRSNQASLIFYFVTEQLFGVYFCYLFVLKVMEFRQFQERDDRSESRIKRQKQNAEQNVRLYVIILLFISGPLAFVIDMWTIGVNTEGAQIALKYGPGARVLIILAVDCVQRAIFKFVEVLPGVSHIVLFIAGILFTCALIGHQYLKDVATGEDGEFIFATMTSTYLFLLQVITFDGWADVARAIIQDKGIWFVPYFIFLTIFVGFFLLNMLVGVMATMTQPKTQELFEKDSIMNQRVDKAAVNQLKEQIDIHLKGQTDQERDEVSQIKSILNSFNTSTDPEDKLYIYVGGQQYEITTKNFIVFDDE